MKFNFEKLKDNKTLNFRPVMFAAVFLVLGILMAALLFNQNVAFFFALVILLSCLVLTYVFNKNVLLVMILVLIVGFGLFYLNFDNASIEEYRKETYIRGRVVEIENGTRDYEHAYLLKDVTLTDGGSSRNAKLYTDELLEVGDIVYSFGIIESFNYDVFNGYSMSYYYDGVNYFFFAEQVMVMSKNNLTGYEKLRNDIRNLYIEHLGEEAGGLSLALFLGDTTLLDGALQENARVSGLSHIFSVSGLHVAFIVAIIVFLGKLLKIKKKYSLIAAMAFVVAYGFLTGFPPSMLRAAAMMFVVIVGYLTRRRYDALSALSFAVILILLIKPLSLFELGFQMSVTSVLGIILFYRPIYNLIKKGTNKFSHYLASSVSLSLSANSLLSVIVFNTFGTFGIYFALSNLILIPYIGVYFGFLFVATIIVLIMPFMKFLLVPLKFVAAGFSEICAAISSLPYAEITTNKLGLISFAYIAIMLLLSGYVMLKNKTKYIAVGAIIGTTVLLAFLF